MNFSCVDNGQFVLNKIAIFMENVIYGFLQLKMLFLLSFCHSSYIDNLFFFITLYVYMSVLCSQKALYMFDDYDDNLIMNL